MGNTASTPSESTIKFVDSAIKSERVLVFSKSYCPYCSQTKSLFTRLQAKATVYELDQRPDGSEIQTYVSQLTGHRTVPSIYIKGQFIGGNDDLQIAYQNGTLVKLLE